MKLVFFIALICFLTSFAKGQKLGVYREGTIFFKKGDSIKGYILIDPSITDQVSFKKTYQDEEDKIPAKKIRCIATQQRYIENIQDGKKERLMHLVIAGKDSLFQYISTEEIIKKTTRDGGTVKGANLNIIYWHKRNGIYTELTENYLIQLSALLSDCKKLEEKLKTNYSYQDVPSLIDSYNKCENQP